MRFLFKLRPGTNPIATVYLRIKIDGVTVDLSTKVRVPRIDWDQARQKINGRSVQVHDDNLWRESIKAQVNRLFLLNQDASARELADLFQEKKPNQYFLTDLVDLFEKDCRAAYPNWETLRTHLTRLGNIRQFIQDRKLQKLKAEQISLGMADDFVNWMKAKGRDHQYIVRHTQSLKSITVGAVRRQILDIDPLAVFRLKKREVVNTDHLSLAELRFLGKYDWEPSLQRVVDLFVFSCYTSLHYKDVQSLQPSDVVLGIDGRQWLDKSRVKYYNSTYFTARYQKVPLHPKILILIEKYGGVDMLPKISNVNYNKSLKQIQYIAGIKIKLTTKIGRKTFTDIMLNEMHVSEEAVAAMLGHSSTRMLKYYGQVDDRRIAHEIIPLFRSFR